MNKFYTWPIIIVFLFVFFPIGLYLIYGRYTFDKTATISNCKGLTISARVFIGFAILCFLVGVFGDPTTMPPGYQSIYIVVIPLIFGPLAWFFLSTAKKLKKMGSMSKQYITSVIKNKQHIIENIAAEVGVSYDQVITDLKQMLEAGYFPGGYIDEATHEFIVPLTASPTSQHNNPTSQTKIVKCQNCGANNTVFVGGANRCEYCGSPIEK